MEKNISRQNLAYQDLTEVPADISQKGTDVYELDLTQNRISELRFLLDYHNLNTLILDHNCIQSHVKIPKMQTLQTLWLNHNKIKNLSTLMSTLCKSCPNLKFFSMMNNEAAPSYFNGGSYQQYMDYRYYVISHLPKLEVLDDKKIDDSERSEAQRIYGRTVVKSRKRTSKKKSQNEVNSI